ncbi:MAG: DEAD/DEAH box helicase, partial [Verrucomicrobiaceae bacterium]|nr:DEAD/DEAH box helicase [Verrucomicrobiaceae bacterium]
MLPSINHLKLPDLWQHEAVNHLRAGSDVIVSAPTGAGKTYIFELLHQSGHFKLKGQAVYTVPTRALANDKYAEWKDAKWDVGIATGDLSENVHAPVLVATLETQIERLVRGEGPAILVIDEYQMIADASRGSHYEGAIALAPPDTRLLLLSGSVANPEDVAAWLRHLGRPAEVVITKDRPVPLEDIPDVALPQRMARHFESYWPKLAASVLLADLAPLLIFAPRRKEAESIARKLAAELPAGEPLQLTSEQRAVCGKELTQLLEHRIAYHHSGLSYAARAGVIEPLAKAGQLRVIAATMGLAAGINFSVRSVHVAATAFHDGRSEHRLTSDELLQMFGRAGRRGLDERGSVITTRQSPSLNDARAARLHRGSILAWPLFLRVMKHAAATGENPFTAAETFATRLYAKVPPPLGLEDLPAGTHSPTPDQPATAALFGLEGYEKQLLNTAGEWQRRSGYPPQKTPLSQC